MAHLDEPVDEYLPHVVGDVGLLVHVGGLGLVLGLGGPQVRVDVLQGELI